MLSQGTATNLSDLAALEKAQGGGQDGYLVIKTDVCSSLLPHGQTFSCDGDDVDLDLQTFSKTIKTPGLLNVTGGNKHVSPETQFSLPSATPEDFLSHSSLPPRDAMEQYITYTFLEQSAPSKYLFLLHGFKKELRRDLGLPEVTLEAGERLLRSLEHLPGIHAEFIYISYGLTVSSAHGEDGWLGSGNVHYWGAPKLWTVIHPVSSNLFECLVMNMLGISTPSCSQFVRHQEIMISPSLLDKHEIKYSVVRQYPGDLVLILGGSYHFVVNEGPNVAGAINYAQTNWVFPPFYRSCGDVACRDCKKTKGCSFDRNPEKKQLTLGKHSRPLELIDHSPSHLTENNNDDGQEKEGTLQSEDETEGSPSYENLSALSVLRPRKPVSQPQESTPEETPKTRKQRTKSASNSGSNSGAKTPKLSSKPFQLEVSGLASLAIGGHVSKKRLVVDRSGLASHPVTIDSSSEAESVEDAVTEINRPTRIDANWESFFQREKPKYPRAKDLCKVLAAASTIGCHGIIHRLAELYGQHDKAIPTELTMPQMVYEVVLLAERVSFRAELTYRLASIYIAHFMQIGEEAMEIHKAPAQPAIQEDITAVQGRGTRSGVLSLPKNLLRAVEEDEEELLTYDWEKILAGKTPLEKGKHDTTVIYNRLIEHISRNKLGNLDFSKHRERIREARRMGKFFKSLSDELFPGKPSVAFGLAMVFPIEPTRSPFDPSIKVSKRTFEDIRKDPIMQGDFLHALRSLRPGLIKQVQGANSVYKTMLFSRESKVGKRLTSVAFKAHAYDDEELLDCFNGKE